MTETATDVTIRPVEAIDIGAIVKIDEKISGEYRPDVWEKRVMYYIRRDPESSVVAEIDGGVVGFMLGEVRSGEFGLEEPTGWIEVLGVDPDCQGKKIGRSLAEAILSNLKERGAVCVRTLVDTEMKDIAGFFESLGFEQASTQPYVKVL